MARALDERVPRVLSGVVVRRLGPGDAAVLDRVAPEVFDHAVDPRWTAEFLADPRHHLVVAIDGDTVVGFASGVHYVHPDKPPELWVNEVGVAPSHQRRGIGRAVVAALFAHGRTLGCREAWLGTEHDNAPARALYAALGGTETSMVILSFDIADDA